MKSIIDVHSHVQFPAYDEDREAVIERAKMAGVKMIAVGTQTTTSEAAIKLAHQYPDNIWATVGYHPNHAVVRSDRSVGAADKWHHDLKEQKKAVPEKFDIEKLRSLAKDPKVAAIGECGLDYYRLAISDKRYETSIKEAQKEVFLQQVELAQELNKPLMIHCRPSKGADDAYHDLLEILNPLPPTLNSIVHFYVGSLAVTKKLVAAGFYFTFGGVITFARDYDESLRYIPLERILLETDCPYVAPAPYRGKRNEPAFIVETAKKMAELKNQDFSQLCEQIYSNSKAVFGIKS